MKGKVVISKFSPGVLGVLFALALLPPSSGWSRKKGNKEAPPPVPRVTVPYSLESVPTSVTAAVVSSRSEAIPRLELPELDHEKKPWTNTSLNNAPKNFQFAIVTDRAGAIRPGIFEDAVKKLNLLQPQFVMSVGDLIQGYTMDQALLNREWTEFEKLVNSLTMPFFYVPGNHDMATPLEKKEWHRRFGPNYYHFLYGNVLFLCMDTEDVPGGGISDEQVEYFRKALQENQHVRWTLVFLHRPLWVKYAQAQRDDSDSHDKKALQQNGWGKIEKLLAGRKYTVYAGHLHSYTKYVRHDNKYFILATTGGGSSLRGVLNYGQFDQVAWVTMTDQGPILANLLLSGIWDENLRTEEVTVLAKTMMAKAVKPEATNIPEPPFTSATVSIRLDNEAGIPMMMKLDAPAGVLRFAEDSQTVVVPPKSVQFARFAVDGSQVSREAQLNDLDFRWTGTYSLPHKPKVEVTGNVTLRFNVSHFSTRAVPGTAIDGKMDEWKNLWGSRQDYAVVQGKKRAWTGMKDSSFNIASQYDDKFLYLAVRVHDEDHAPVKDDHWKTGDYVLLTLAPGGSGEKDPGEGKIVRVALAPDPGNNPRGLMRSHDSSLFKSSCVRTDDGYVAEVSIPIEELNKAQGGQWKDARVNVRVNDRDDHSRSAVVWWKPAWKTSPPSSNAGIFLKK